MVAFWWSSVITNFGAGTSYITDTSSWLVLSASEAFVQTKMDKAGILSTLTCRFSANASTGTTTVSSRKNGAAGNLTISIATLTTGYVSDIINADALAVGDLTNLVVVNGGTGNCTITNTRVVFNSTGSAVQMIGNSGASTSVSSTTQYQLVGGAGGGNTTDSVVIMRTHAPATWSNLQCYFDTNARTTTTTVGTRINTTNGNQILSVGAGLTGLFNDTTHTDTIANGDNIKYYYTTGASAESLDFTSATTTMASSTDAWLCTASILGISLTAATTYAMTVSGTPTTSTTGDTSMQMSTGIDYTCLSDLYVSVNSNATTTATSLTLRKNAANTSLTLSITAGTSGVFEDLVHSETVGAFDMLTMGSVVGATGNVVAIGYSMLASVIGSAKAFNYTQAVKRAGTY